ncbi:hypothetical protein Pelo_9456 [Pelomyxa schiedti]|nr:hypothetical protein Pelo_9456 [Pelomyxa schiedti]
MSGGGGGGIKNSIMGGGGGGGVGGTGTGSGGRATLQGHLYKQGPTGSLRSWKRRWFVMRNNRLFYYESSRDIADCVPYRGFVDLSLAREVSASPAAALANAAGPQSQSQPQTSMAVTSSMFGGAILGGGTPGGGNSSGWGGNSGGASGGGSNANSSGGGGSGGFSFGNLPLAVEDVDFRWVFHIYTPARVWKLLAPSEYEMWYWIEGIQHVLLKLNLGFFTEENLDDIPKLKDQNTRLKIRIQQLEKQLDDNQTFSRILARELFTDPHSHLIEPNENITRQSRPPTYHLFRSYTWPVYRDLPAVPLPRSTFSNSTTSLPPFVQSSTTAPIPSTVTNISINHAITPANSPQKETTPSSSVVTPHYSVPTFSPPLGYSLAPGSPLRRSSPTSFPNFEELGKVVLAECRLQKEELKVLRSRVESELKQIRCELARTTATIEKELTEVRQDLRVSTTLKSRVAALPAKDKQLWVPSATTCFMCSAQFTLVRRQHHCRNCGQVFCAACANQRCRVPGYQSLERVCEPCYIEVQMRYLTPPTETGTPPQHNL